MPSRFRQTAGLLLPVLGLSVVVLLLFVRRPGAPAPDLSVVQLTFDGAGVANHFPVASPDGRYVLFQRCDEPVSTKNAEGKTVYHFKEDESNWDIYRIRVDGSERLRLTDSPAVEDEPAWSPDGGTIAYRRINQANLAIWLMDADGRNQRPLVEDPNAHAKTPAFSPDGGKVIFTANRAARQSWNLFTIDLATRGIEQLTTGAFEDKHPQFAPDGREIIFHSDRNNLTIRTGGPHKLMRLFSLDLETRHPQPLAEPDEPRDDRHAFASPDGRFLVYHSLAFGPDPRHPNQYKKVNEDIYVTTRDGRKRVNVTRGDRRYFKHPSWSADGKGVFCIFKERRNGADVEKGAWNLCYIDVREALAQLD